jgi:hypothetical protein
MAANFLIPLAVLAWLLYRQVQRRPIGGRGAGGRGGRRRQVGLILLVIGAIQLVEFAQRHTLTADTVGILGLSFLVGAGLAVARAFTVRLWFEDGQLFRQGTALTVLLWLVAAGLHLASAAAISRAGGPSGAGSASLLLYLALSLTIQALVLRHRARTEVAAMRSAAAARA